MSALNTVLLLIHMLIALALVGVVLLQRSEGGALGIGGGGGGFMTGRGTANLLTRITAALALCFFATSLLLTVVGQRTAPKGSAFDKPAATSTTAPATDTTSPSSSSTSTPSSSPATPTPAPAAPAPSGGILDKLK